jgi:hypothetical protein
MAELAYGDNRTIVAQFCQEKKLGCCNTSFTITNGKLCVPMLVNISLHVFLNDSQQISDDFGLFLQITTDGATTVIPKQYYWRTDFV